MVQYARLVFETVELKDNTTPKEAMKILLESIKNYLENPNEEDVEMSESPYERME